MEVEQAIQLVRDALEELTNREHLSQEQIRYLRKDAASRHLHLTSLRPGWFRSLEVYSNALRLSPRVAFSFRGGEVLFSLLVGHRAAGTIRSVARWWLNRSKMPLKGK
jgi:hypothetical protein